MTDQVVSRSVVVDAAPEVIFDLLADPAQHPELDGSGSVRAATTGPARLSLGARFGMAMKLGLPYRIRNEVVEFEENRLIAWRHGGHHVWRWQLEPVAGAAAPQTTVTESFDYRPARSPRVLELTGMVGKNTAGIEATLAKLQHRFAATG